MPEPDSPDLIENYNIIVMGNLKLQSPDVPMDKLIRYVLTILKNKDMREFLENTKTKDILKGGSYFG